MRLGRLAAVSTALAALLLAGTGDAWAGDDFWGGMDCARGPAAGCELSPGHTPPPSGARPGAPTPDARSIRQMWKVSTTSRLLKSAWS
jgi:hypothetical protein